jgi:tetratricopeptide (TPR) repeat protein
MTRKAIASLISLAGLITVTPTWAQKTDSTRPAASDKAAAYYHYTMGHLYGELAGSYGSRGDYLNKAVDHYRQALKLDPNSGYLAEELSDLYLQSNRLREGVSEAEESLKQNPEDLGARRILGRIYTRLIGDTAQGSINKEMLKRALEQYQKIAEKSPNEVDTWVMLGRLYKISQDSPEAEKAYRKVLDIDANNEEALTGLAMVYADLGDSARASQMMKRLADKNPSLRNLAMLASTFEQARDYKSASQTLQQALELQPENKELRRALAQNLLLSDNQDAALKLYQEMAAADPKDAVAQLRISMIYLQKRDFAKAREANQKAKDVDPNNLDVLYNEVRLLEAEGKMNQAISTLKGILEAGTKRTYNIEEKNTRAQLLDRLAQLYRVSDQNELAVATFRQVGELDPGRSAGVSAAIIGTYRAAKEFNKALEEADAAVKKNPDNKPLAALHAEVLAEMGRNEQALAETKRLLGDKPDRETLISAAEVYEKTKSYAEMTKVLDEAAKLSMTTDEKQVVYFLRGAMYEKQKKFDLSEAEFRKVLEIDPSNAAALNYLGYMFADRGVRLQEAHQMIKKALEQDPNNGAYLDSMGWVYYRQDKLKEAEDSLLRALEKYSRDPTVHDHLGDVYFKQGRLREAINQWQSSLKEWDTSAASERDAVEVARVQKKLEGAKVRLAKEGNLQKP